MRPIQFRGKHVNDESVFANEWVCGDLLHTADGVPHIHQIETDSYFEIYPETVGQFTGLLDKNGVAIYEGDIMPIYENGEEYIYKVLYDGDCFMLGFIDSEQGSYPLSTKYNISEVVGNIHDNPELLKNEQL